LVVITKQTVKHQSARRGHFGVAVDQRRRILAEYGTAIAAVVHQLLPSLDGRQVQSEAERGDRHPCRERHLQRDGAGIDPQHEAAGDGEDVENRLVLQHVGVGHVQHEVGTDHQHQRGILGEGCGEQSEQNRQEDRGLACGD
jgi:hypothetical protein